METIGSMVVEKLSMDAPGCFHGRMVRGLLKEGDQVQVVRASRSFDQPGTVHTIKLPHERYGTITPEGATSVAGYVSASRDRYAVSGQSCKVVLRGGVPLEERDVLFVVPQGLVRVAGEFAYAQNLGFDLRLVLQTAEHEPQAVVVPMTVARKYVPQMHRALRLTKQQKAGTLLSTAVFDLWQKKLKVGDLIRAEGQVEANHLTASALDWFVEDKWLSDTRPRDHEHYNHPSMWRRRKAT